jgi:hypothetical protein
VAVDGEPEVHDIGAEPSETHVDMLAEQAKGRRALVISSSPATMRSTLVLPQPDGFNVTTYLQ